MAGVCHDLTGGDLTKLIESPWFVPEYHPAVLRKQDDLPSMEFWGLWWVLFTLQALCLGAHGKTEIGPSQP